MVWYLDEVKEDLNDAWIEETSGFVVAVIPVPGDWVAMMKTMIGDPSAALSQ